MVLVAVEAVPAGSKPPATISVCISKGERHGFGAAALLSAKASSLQGRSAVLPKLVKLVGPISTFLAEELSPTCVASYAATSSVRLRVLVSGSTSAFVARRGCQASCSRPAKWLSYLSHLLRKLVQLFILLTEMALYSI